MLKRCKNGWNSTLTDISNGVYQLSQLSSGNCRTSSPITDEKAVCTPNKKSLGWQSYTCIDIVWWVLSPWNNDHQVKIQRNTWKENQLNYIDVLLSCKFQSIYGCCCSTEVKLAINLQWTGLLENIDQRLCILTVESCWQHKMAQWWVLLSTSHMWMGESVHFFSQLALWLIEKIQGIHGQP